MTARRLAPLALVLPILALAGCSGSADIPAITKTVTPSPTSQPSDSSVPSATPTVFATYAFPARGPEPYPGFCEDAQEYMNATDHVGETVSVDLPEATDPGDLDSIHTMGSLLADAVDDATAVLNKIEATGIPVAVSFASSELAGIPLTWGAIADLAISATDVSSFQVDLATLKDSFESIDAGQGSGASAEYWDLADKNCYLAG